jgi:hypothetical protein
MEQFVLAQVRQLEVKNMPFLTSLFFDIGGQRAVFYQKSV